METDPPAVTPPCGFLSAPPQTVDTPMLLSLGVALAFIAAQLWAGLG